MAFSDFRYPAVLQEFGLSESASTDLFAGVPPVASGPLSQVIFPTGIQLALSINTEKARSGWMIAPVLSDLWSRYGGRISLFSGIEFDADADAKLTGRCDFLIGRGPHVPHLQAPVLTVVEAKNDNVLDGLGQCIAGMVGLQRFNRRANAPIDPVYGCSTTGTAWKFLRLSGSALVIDLMEYTIHQIDRLLGIFVAIVGMPITPLTG